ncbi:AAA family ATPase [Helicobacter cetorum]|uniref:AAA family ATPase n=1 Tax=Helicobacter cetorum TaxID=138563 RepID=UPI000CF129CB|nr:ATP/GTP-binding protein [Helicobacter cetorum]
MIKSVRIKNYKNFKDFDIKDFALINFFTGKNDVGKTNILEALYINTGICYPSTNESSLPIEHAIHTNHFRQMKSTINNLKSMFYHQNFLEPISIITEFDDKIIPLTIEYKFSKNYNKEISLDNEIKNNNKEELHFICDKTCEPMVLSYKNDVKNLQIICPSLNNLQKFYKEHAIFVPIELINIKPTNILQSIRKNNQEKELIEILQLFNSDIIDAEVISSDETIEGVAIKIKDEKKETKSSKRFLNLFGWGFVKFFVIASILVSKKTKYLFIDEIENGLHYSKMQEFLKALFKLAKNSHIQIFATTHNKEFLTNAMQPLLMDFKDIALFNLYKEDNHYNFIRYSHSMLNKALFRGMETRD